MAYSAFEEKHGKLDFISDIILNSTVFYDNGRLFSTNCDFLNRERKDIPRSLTLFVGLSGMWTLSVVEDSI